MAELVPQVAGKEPDVYKQPNVYPNGNVRKGQAVSFSLFCRTVNWNSWL